MGLYDYLKLSQEEQWDILWDVGVYITSYKSIDCSYRLYAIDKFFVEVEMCVSKETVLGMGIFKEGKKLEKYFSNTNIDISQSI